MLRFRVAAVVLASAIALSLTHQCNAWGAQGHRIIGQIAWQYLTPEAKAGVESILGSEPLGAAGTWADEVRSDHAYDWIKPLHFVNVPQDAESIDLARDCKDGQCVVEAIRKYRDRATDKSLQQADRLMALRLLIHFVGDVHQPLHVSYAEDRGGNKRSLTYMGKRSNFHKVWDSDLIEQRIGRDDWMVYASELQSHITDDQVAQFQRTSDPLAWANETLGITRQLYRELDTDELSAAYYEKNLPVVEDQLERAGVRLAAILNAMFATARQSAREHRADFTTVIRIAWLISTLLVAAYLAVTGLGYPPRQPGHPWWATAFAVLALQAGACLLVWAAR